MTSPSRGRPQASSRETLADAACELFLEQGYEATTVADITRRAGVSRSSFFNYFDGKAGAIWFTLDAHLEELAHGAPRENGSTLLGELRERLATLPPHTLALAIANAEAMGVAAELASGRALRQAALADELRRADGGARGAISGGDAVGAEIVASAQAAAVFGAIWQWATLGAGTHSLDTEIDQALASVPLVGGERPMRVVVIGTGTIGARVAGDLLAGTITGAVLAGVITRRAGAVAEAFGEDANRVVDFGSDLEGAMRESDLIVECAGIPAAQTYAPRIIAGGKPVLLVSIGALADTGMRAALEAGPGALLLSTGAIGGLDLLSAAARPHGIPGGIERAQITSTKRATSLIQGWMSESEADRLRRATEPFELFGGSVAEAIEKFPGSLNVACALAAATGLWEETRVRLVADPNASRTTHAIEAGGAAGDYNFTVTNAVSPQNPASSAVVAEAVLRGISAVARPSGTFV